MGKYMLRRVGLMLVTLVAISFVTFWIIQLPPGDYVSTIVAQAEARGEVISPEQMAALRARYGLDVPLMVQYWHARSVVRFHGDLRRSIVLNRHAIYRIYFHGDFGKSFAWNRPVSTLIWDRVALSFFLSISTLLFVWAVAFPIGIYSAVKQYSPGDYVATFFGFVGMAIPD